MNFLQAFIHETARCEENGDSRLETEGPKVRPLRIADRQHSLTGA
jgi:hypothetical protein